MQTIEEIVRSYFENQIDIKKVRSELQFHVGKNWKSFLYDSDVPVYQLTRRNLIETLDKYLNSEIGDQQLIDWASNAIFWEAITFDPVDAELISSVLFDIDNMLEDGWNLTKEDLKKYVVYLNTIKNPNTCAKVIENWVAQKAAKRKVRK